MWHPFPYQKVCSTGLSHHKDLDDLRCALIEFNSNVTVMGLRQRDRRSVLSLIKFVEESALPDDALVLLLQVPAFGLLEE